MNNEALSTFPDGEPPGREARSLTGTHEYQEHNECKIVEFRLGNRDRDSLHENYVLEIDAWARQAMASNGFGDY